METILTLTYLYLLVLLLALLVERIMEVIMAIWNYGELKFKSHRYWNRRTKKLVDKYSRKARSRLLTGALTITGLARRVRHYTRDETGMRSGQVIVFSGEAVRHVYIRTLAFITTSVLGIILCNAAGINLIRIIQEAMGSDPLPILDILSERMQLVVSGIAVGLGAEPVHQVITGLERWQEMKANRDRLDQAIVDVAVKSIRM